MKSVFIKVLCWVAGIGAVGYIGLTIARSIPYTGQIVGMIPFIGQIPTPVIEPLAEAVYDCSWTYGESKAVRISDAPASEGSYPRWECVVQNPNKTEEEYQAYLTELKKYKEWPRDPNYDLDTYLEAECKFYEGLSYGFERDEFHCIIPLQYQGAANGETVYQNSLNSLEYYKSVRHTNDIKIIDYSKE